MTISKWQLIVLAIIIALLGFAVGDRIEDYLWPD
jgi:hypothetical protein